MNDYWGRFGESYDANQQYVVGEELIDAVKARIRALPSLGRTVELGCGTGLYSQVLAPRTEHLTATDYSEDLLSIAGRRLQNVDNVSLQREDCMRLSLADGSMDSVFMANLIHVVESPERTLSEALRILRPGKTLVIATFTTSGMSGWQSLKMALRFLKVWGKPPKTTHSFTPKTLADLVAAAGFTVQQTETIGTSTKSIFLLAHAPTKAE